MSRIFLRAPGLYLEPPQPQRSLAAVRMDVCAFVGVAPRGPARQPWLDETWTYDQPCVTVERRRRSVAVPVESFDEYHRLFGGFEGGSRLPHAVSSYFQQGGQRAYIVRIVHDYDDPVLNGQGVARGQIDGVKTSVGPLYLNARNEGRWGNRLRAALGFSVEPKSFEAVSNRELLFDELQAPPPGALLRLRFSGGQNVLRFVIASTPQPDGDGSRVIRCTLDVAVGTALESVEQVEGVLLIDDADGRQERHERLGLSSDHPRWMGTVLCYESELVYPHPSWVESEIQLPSADDLPIEPILPDGLKRQFDGGLDRYNDITPDDFFDLEWVLGNPDSGDGVHSLVFLDDLSSVVVPDLYSPEPIADDEQVEDPPPRVGPEFEDCPDDSGESAEAEPVIEPKRELTGLRLDPNIPADLKRIIGYQQKLVALADTLRNFVVLLDVPPRLSHRQVLKWRTKFRSSYAAAYHPWFLAASSDSSRLIRLNPSAAAAGIIARREIQFGVPHAPANVLIENAISVDEAISPEQHDELHPQGINVLLRERDGILVTAARTLSDDRQYRQLSVRRMLLMLRRVLEQQMLWMVFEPNGPALWSDVRQVLENYLRQLYQAGAFRGATEAEAYFVHCDATLNPPRVVDAGQLIVEIGVALSEPVEFIVIRIRVGSDGVELAEV